MPILDYPLPEKGADFLFRHYVTEKDMKKSLCIVICFLLQFAYSSPVKSMLGADGVSQIYDEGSPLPEGVVAVEYLESTGTQYINTRYALSSYDVVSCKVIFNNRNSIFGVYQSGKMFNLTGSGNATMFRFGSTYKSVATTIGVPYIFNCGINYSIDGDVKNIFTDSFIGDTECLMFARRAGAYIQDYLIGRIYWLRIKNDNGLVRDFIPVRVGEGENAVGYMYDFVSGELFGNIGSGSFIIGPDME